MSELGPSKSDAAQSMHAATCRMQLLPEPHAVRQPACCSTTCCSQPPPGRISWLLRNLYIAMWGPGSSKLHHSRPLWSLLQAQ